MPQMPKRPFGFYPRVPVKPFGEAFKQCSNIPLLPELKGLEKADSIGAAGTDFDHYLVETRAGPKLICVMKLYFLFVTGHQEWKPNQMIRFMARWRQEIAAKWNMKALTTTASKRIVGLEFHFDTSMFTAAGRHWTVRVQKVNPKIFGESQVNVTRRTVDLFSNDFDPVNRDGYIQRPVMHEFAHLVRRPPNRDDWDEYKEKSQYLGDRPSILNHGEVIRPRHMEWLKGWVDLVSSELPAEKAHVLMTPRAVRF